NKHYEEQFPLSQGKLRELLLKRSAAFATAFGGQWRQREYPAAIGNAAAGLLDLAGATIAGGTWEETTQNLVKGILIGGALGAAFGSVGSSGAALGPDSSASLAADASGESLPASSPPPGADAEAQLGAGHGTPVDALAPEGLGSVPRESPQ